MSAENSPNELNGEDLIRAITAIVESLEQHASAINAMNVFPVPDGDTGTNMFLTVKAMWEEATLQQQPLANQVLASMARGALFGARGNSGVILSQFFRGLSEALQDEPTVNAQGLVRALREGQIAAYTAVSQPVEGTMLTVIRQAAEGARQSTDQDNVLEILRVACQSAKAAVQMTPEQLPVLKQAGVVDAGGLGIVVILEAMWRTLSGETPQITIEVDPTYAPTSIVQEDFLHATEANVYGYCTQFIIQGCNLNIDAIRQNIDNLGSSTVIVGNPEMIRVHTHAIDPGPIISYAISQGQLSQVKLDNMDEQHLEFMSTNRAAQAPISVLAITSGDGFAEVFRQLGSGVLMCGQTMNPSAQEILSKAKTLGAQVTLILPNNPNVILAAQQASGLATESLVVVDSSTIPEGIAALLAFNPEEDVHDNLEAMRQATHSVKTAEVTRAEHDAKIDGIQCTAGQLIGLLDGRLLVSGEDATEVLYFLLDSANLEDGGLVTLYYGQEMPPDQAQQTFGKIGARFPHTEMELVYGGQPLYSYILSIE